MLCNFEQNELEKEKTSHQLCVNLTFSGEDSVSIQGVSAQAGLSREVQYTYFLSSSSFLLDFLHHFTSKTALSTWLFCRLPENGEKAKLWKFKQKYSKNFGFSEPKIISAK